MNEDKKEIIEFWSKQREGKTVCLCQCAITKELFCFPSAAPPDPINWILLIRAVCGVVTA